MHPSKSCIPATALPPVAEAGIALLLPPKSLHEQLHYQLVFYVGGGYMFAEYM
jgi:hypothetical protein